jgi:hypothetical protein
MTAAVMTQSAAWPAVLEHLVEVTGYKPGWTFELRDMVRGQDCAGLTLLITVHVEDSRRPGLMTGVAHYMPVPAAAYDERAWRRWILDQVLLVEAHEAMEFLTFDGDRVFEPVHAPGANPYTVTELATDTERRTSFRGILDDPR